MSLIKRSSFFSTNYQLLNLGITKSSLLDIFSSLVLHKKFTFQTLEKKKTNSVSPYLSFPPTQCRPNMFAELQLYSFNVFNELVFPQNTDDGNITVSILSFIPDSVDDGKHITCRVENPMLPGTALEDTSKVDVQCK